LGKNFLSIYNKFLRFEKIIDEEFVEVGSDEDIDYDDDGDDVNDEEEHKVNVGKFNLQLKNELVIFIF
jgi:hypothetical protein